MKLFRNDILFLIFSCLLTVCGFTQDQVFRTGTPQEAGLNPVYIEQAFAEVQQAIAKGAAPGAVGLIVKDKKIIAHEALGNMQTHEWRFLPDGKELLYKPMRVPCRRIRFSTASLTKWWWRFHPS